MYLIIAFLIINIVFAKFLETKKYKIATVLHSVLFIMILLFLLVTSDVTFITIGIRNVIGKETYDILYEVLTSTIISSIFILTPILLINIIINIFVLLFEVFITILISKEIVKIYKIVKIKNIIYIKHIIYKKLLNKIKIIKRIFIINRSIRCWY